MTRGEVACTPIGEMGDLVACYQIFNGATPRGEADDDEMIPDLD